MSPLAGQAPSLSELAKRSKTDKQDKSLPGDTATMKPVTNTVVPEAQESPTFFDHAPEGVVKWRLFGTGGAGKSAALHYSKSNRFNTEITTIDTSGVEEISQGVESIRIEGLNGSGKYRAKNIDPIMTFISDYVPQTRFADVNVIVHSFSGGSGSVIAPLLVDEILRQNKIAIVIGILDTDSEIDTVNALNTLRTLDNFVKQRGSYLPVMLFDNNFGRYVVDRGINMMIKHLSVIFDVPYIGLDLEDRIKFIRPDAFDGVKGGIKMLCLSQLPLGSWYEDIGLVIPTNQSERIDATIIISSTNDNLQLTNLCKATFRGFYENEGVNTVGSVGYQIPVALIDKLNNSIHSHKNVQPKAATVIKSEHNTGEVSSNGMVL